ncbi:MAG: GNAT family N-acetyltransferase [Holdemanella sp.]|nr:GNAT family N-acetyltransferase [Holdemanella sp.]
MKCVIKPFNALNVDELYEILRLRSEVFVLEQTCLYQDMDGIDKDSIHLYIEDHGVVACARLFERNAHTMQLGRLCTKYRARGYGKIIVMEAINKCRESGYDSIYIEAQEYAIPFYEKFGFYTISKVFLEDGIPHVKMVLKISEKT